MVQISFEIVSTHSLQIQRIVRTLLFSFMLISPACLWWVNILLERIFGNATMMNPSCMQWLTTMANDDKCLNFWEIIQEHQIFSPHASCALPLSHQSTKRCGTTIRCRRFASPVWSNLIREEEVMQEDEDLDKKKAIPRFERFDHAT